MTPEFQALLIEARARHGSVGALAKVLRLTRQRTSDALGGGRGYSLDVERSLRLAIDGGHNPYDVLRKAGHLHEAELLEKLFGPWLAEESDRLVLRAVADRLAGRSGQTDAQIPPARADVDASPKRRRRR